ncbi:outer membrane protein assembly factor BamB family protein [Spirosoma fluviale]|uniref:Quinoprotein glucose dehydrogenase n=1 Tax=Spirosoma fluviale TaxID=1597977 RepID=A0A286GDA9_9BACT|nr:PQQ-binding-like beta-propeller repeat protein [Spirosoma fluviale]SOD92984.1 quinoprotein glucose dehydrogenase [Spirosoma fluviale]
MNRFLKPLFSLLILGSFVSLKDDTKPVNQSPPNDDWPTYGGNNAGNRYSKLSQINTQTVKNLKLAWSYDTGDNKDTSQRGMDIQCQPIVVKGVLYGTSPRLKLFAVDAATGKQHWQFDPFADPDSKPRFHPMRGVMYWEDGDDKRVLYTVGSFLYAVNATTGKLVESFGKQGKVDLHEGLGDKETIGHDVANLSIRVTTPGVIYKDLLITGSAVSEGGDAPPGYIRAFNVRSGKLEWVFHTIPLPGEYGYETWAKDSYKKLGGANCWAGMVLDEKRGVVYAGTGSPSVDFYGGAREGQNLFANCVIALNATTGKRIWHFQTVHHDLWDRDLPCPPNLMTVKHTGPDGRTRLVDAVAQATKDGYVFVLDRDTGKPLFPVKEVPVMTSPALPGEKPWPTQPVPIKPAPFVRQELTENEITTRTPEAHAYVLDRYRNSRHGSKYMPPSIEGTLYYGFGGGAEWGGNAADPDGILYQNANTMLWWLKMRDVRAKTDGVAFTRGGSLFNTNCAACHAAGEKSGGASQTAQAYPNLTDVGKRLTKEQIASILVTGRGRMPSFGHLSTDDREAIIRFLLKQDAKPVPKAAVATASAANDLHSSVVKTPTAEGADFPYSPPYLNNGNTQFRDQDNYPAIKPPWGTLNAINLNTGEYLWQVPLGEYPELTKKGIPPTGTENHGGPIVTAGGLVFIAATYDEKIRAFDKKTGKIVWDYKLPAGGFATPITYMVNGKQYIVIAAGGTRYGLKPGGSYVAFALP